MTLQKWQIIAWMVCLPLVVLGSFVSLTLPLTLIIEILLAMGVALIRKKGTTTLVTLVMIGNLVTQVGLWVVLTSSPLNNYWGVLGTSEVAIWLTEALILYFPMHNSISLREAMGMSLMFNGTSFGLGLLLPF
jgi:hypothetical protein